MNDSHTTKVLFVDSDELSFQFRKCMAGVIQNLPPLDLYHASDATEALLLIESLLPDVIIIDDENSGEKELLIDNLPLAHPPIIVQTDSLEELEKTLAGFDIDKCINHIPRSESIEGIHKTLLLAAKIGENSAGSARADLLH